MNDEFYELLERHCHGDITSTIIPSLAISRTGLTTEPLTATRYPMLCAVARGQKRVRLASETFFFDESRYLLVSVNLPVTGEIIREPYLGMSLTLDPEVLASLLLEMPPPEALPASSCPLAVCAMDDKLREALLRLLRLLDEPAHAPFLAPLAQREILYRLLVGPGGHLLRELALPTSQLSQVSSAIKLIRRRYKQTIRTKELLRSVSMSAPTFHRHFKAVTNLSPLQFQKRIQLQESRRLLLTQNLDPASAAFAVGYKSVTQFSREYHRLFGAPPAHDAMQAHQTINPPRSPSETSPELEWRQNMEKIVR